MPDGQKDRVKQCAADIIDAIPEALGMTPDPWPIDGPSYDGEPHKTVERLLALLLAEAHPQIAEKKEDTDTRVDDSQYPRKPLATAASNELVPTTDHSDAFTQSFDARDWARAFVEHVTANPAIATDEGTMIGWFANAIMRGYDEHARRAALPEIEAGDVPETTTDNPQSWIAWKRRAFAAETALREVVTNGEWRGVEWVISTAVYEMAAEALTDSPAPAPVTPTPPHDWYPIENPPRDGEYVLLVSPAHGRVIGAHISGDVWHLVGVGAITSASERPTHWMELPAAPLARPPQEEP